MAIEIIKLRPHNVTTDMNARLKKYMYANCRHMDKDTEEMYIHMIREAFKSGYRAGRKAMKGE